MIRQIVKIDEELCNGCGLCITACHEGAIALENGKAKLIRDDYCDGLGNCLPVCPTGAITFEEREAAAYDEAAVEANTAAKKACEATEPTEAAQAAHHGHHHGEGHGHGGGCPGSMARALHREAPRMGGCPGSMAKAIAREQVVTSPAASVNAGPAQSQLAQWPVQIKLVPVNAPYFDGAHLLVAADCTAFSYADFHRDFMKKHVTIIGCPKLDEGDYAEKLTEILRRNNIKSVKVARMEVPCCGGIENAVKQALVNSGKMIPWQVVTISTDGQILED